MARELVSKEQILILAREHNTPLPVSGKGLGDRALVYHVIETQEVSGAFTRKPGAGLMRAWLLKKYF